MQAVPLSQGGGWGATLYTTQLDTLLIYEITSRAFMACQQGPQVIVQHLGGVSNASCTSITKESRRRHWSFGLLWKVRDKKKGDPEVC